MPAVDPARLRFRVEDLLTHFNSPSVFHRELQHLFDLYANRVLRQGAHAPPKPLIPTYNLPRMVTRQLELDLKPHIIENPQAALALADDLWIDDYFEVKQLAIFLLGTVPLEEPDLICQRVESWATPQVDQSVLTVLLSRGVVKLQNTFPQAWAEMVESYLTGDDPKMTAIGILALTEGVKNLALTNLPVIFRLASPVLRHPHNTAMKYLQALVEAMAQVSPTETTFFLKQTLATTTSPNTPRLVKQCLGSFPESARQDLAATLKQ